MAMKPKQDARQTPGYFEPSNVEKPSFKRKKFCQKHVQNCIEIPFFSKKTKFRVKVTF